MFYNTFGSDNMLFDLLDLHVSYSSFKPTYRNVHQFTVSVESPSHSPQHNLAHSSSLLRDWLTKRIYGLPTVEIRLSWFGTGAWSSGIPAVSYLWWPLADHGRLRIHLVRSGFDQLPSQADIEVSRNFVLELLPVHLHGRVVGEINPRGSLAVS